MKQKLIDADDLSSSMYHEAFETDTDMQKWDSGCWIRYKMFEKQLEAQPAVEAIPIEWILTWACEFCNPNSEGYKMAMELMHDWRKENGTN